MVGDFRYRKNKWGGCTNDRHIRLNEDLIIAPKQRIKHVVIPEMCQLREHNYGDGLYRRVHLMRRSPSSLPIGLQTGHQLRMVAGLRFFASSGNDFKHRVSS